jgi:hypothetical protein
MKNYRQIFSDALKQNGKILIQRPRCQGKRKMYYKLDENKNVVESSLHEWATFIENRLPNNYKHVGDDIVDGHRISTVFLGLCHNFDPFDKTPIVFETMVFQSDRRDIYLERYSTWQEAEAGHQRAIQWVKDGCKEDKL